MARYGTSMNLDGIWGGNMYRGRLRRDPAEQDHLEAQLPLRAEHGRHRHLAKLRTHLDKHGYKDVEIKVIGDVPWAKMRYDTDIATGADAARTTSSASATTARRRAVDSRAVLAGVSVRRRSARHSDRRRSGRTRRQQPRGQRVLRHRRRRTGLRHRRRREIRWPRCSTTSRELNRCLPTHSQIERSQQRPTRRRRHGARAARRVARHRGRGVRDDRRAVGLGQVDVHAHPRLPR